MSEHGPIRNLDLALRVLDEEIVHTDKGAYIRVDRLKEVMGQNREAAINAMQEAPRPKTFAQARRMVYQDQELMDMFDHDPRAPGGSTPAMEPQPPSRA